MRFIQDGPLIPDELLLARDQGHVVFFCGAGISLAKAKLPNFFQLAQKVIDLLGTTNDSQARQLYDFLNKGLKNKEGNEVALPSYASTLISTDRIFSLLEQEFETNLIEKTVAQVLKPSDTVDTSAHKLLLDLATTSKGRVQLITTNFDRLFNECSLTEIPCFLPPNLPDLSKNELIDGLVYLHGRSNSDYIGAEGNGFVLSGSEFGRAYLSDGWATNFIREIFSKYTVVFIGYSANDPPMQYLLEGLNKNLIKAKNVYAFQSGTIEEARKLWEHKGVQAIAYSPEDKHTALWETLDAWAKKAKNVEQWYSETIEIARRGPTNLLPHERGQVAHIVSTSKGMKKFALIDNPPPAEWLCVFDRNIRLATHSNNHWPLRCNTSPEPFTLYGLDFDKTPDIYQKNNEDIDKEIAKKAWDAFQPHHDDIKELNKKHFASFRTTSEYGNSKLSNRQWFLGVWLAKVAHQPTAIWWATKQNYLEPAIQHYILQKLKENKVDSEIRKIWQYLIESWQYEYKDEDFERHWYSLSHEIKTYGWNEVTFRQYVKLTRPYLAVSSKINSLLPPINTITEFREFLQLDVRYIEKHHFDAINIPNSLLIKVIPELRKNIEYAYSLESEKRTPHSVRLLSPIREDSSIELGLSIRDVRLEGYVLRYVHLYERLIQLDLYEARNEFLSWPRNNPIFSQLRIWIACKPKIVPSSDFYPLINALSDDEFWNKHNQRDLMLTLADRWDELRENECIEIVERLLKGRLIPTWIDSNLGDKWQADSILNRIFWLKNKGCHFYIDIKERVRELQNIYPEWEIELENNATTSMKSKGGYISIESNRNELLYIPIRDIIPQALKFNCVEQIVSKKNDPFKGLSQQYPLRAFSALRHWAKDKKEYPKEIWKKFLSSESRKDDKTKFIYFIARQMMSYSNEDLVSIIDPTLCWISSINEKLASIDIDIYDALLKHLINTIGVMPTPITTIEIKRERRDWIPEADNSPISSIAHILFKDSRLNNFYLEDKLSQQWFSHIERLNALSGDSRKYALVYLAKQLIWLHHHIPVWTNNNLLHVIENGEPDEKEAFWNGYFWGGTFPGSSQLYDTLKPFLLGFLRNSMSFHPEFQTNSIANFLLFGWASKLYEKSKQFISDSEFRDALFYGDEKLRHKILWLLWRLSSKDEPDNKFFLQWRDLIIQFFTHVWPRQKAIKSPETTENISRLLFSQETMFPKLVDIVMPFLTCTNNGASLMYYIKNEAIVKKFPKETIAVLSNTLPEDVKKWPYDFEKWLEKMEKADASLGSDSKFIELKYKWEYR
ncbi:SIR2 family protein [Photorhabdus laumondii]|uniref:SIR2 family NAD-dependent protein deacylase n=1 Tax=Photorhabdus laumondii TaxID=2218628 RepID=UPI00331564E0